jgi:hypothetical protein
MEMSEEGNEELQRNGNIAMDLLFSEHKYL